MVVFGLSSVACTVAPDPSDGESFGGMSTADAESGTSSGSGGTASEDPASVTSDDLNDDGTTESSSTGSDAGDESSTGDPEGECLGLGGLESYGEVYVAEGGEAGACEVESAACESDPTGTWTWTDVCGPVSVGVLYDCDGGTQTVTYHVGGTRSLANDGGYAESLTTTTTINVSLDSQTCLGQDCAAFEQTLSSDWGGAATCVDNGGTCACEAIGGSRWSVEGAWTAEGSTLSIDYGGQVVEYDFCAGDQALRLWSSIPMVDLTGEPCETAADCEAALGDAYDSYECAVVDGDEPGQPD